MPCSNSHGDLHLDNLRTKYRDGRAPPTEGTDPRGTDRDSHLCFLAGGGAGVEVSWLAEPAAAAAFFFLGVSCLRLRFGVETAGVVGADLFPDDDFCLGACWSRPIAALINTLRFESSRRQSSASLTTSGSSRCGDDKKGALRSSVTCFDEIRRDVSHRAESRLWTVTW